MGGNYRGSCPICKGDNDTELTVYDNKSYHCWKCKSSGDVINFVMEMELMDFNSAVEKLADELNIDIDRDPLYKIKKEKISERERIAREAEKSVANIKEYLIKERGLLEETITNFRIGSNSKAEVVIPLRDVNSRVIAFARRRFEGQPKYINSKNDDVYEKSSFLFNLDQAKRLLDSNVLYAVEGQFCAMSLDQDGKAAVAYCSIEPTKDQILLISKYLKIHPYLTLIWIPDNDGKAYKCVPRMREKLLKIAPKLTVLIGVLPEGIKDVNDLYCAKRTVKDLDLIPIDMFSLKMVLNDCPTKTTEQTAAVDFIKTVKSPVTKNDIASFLSEKWNKPINVIRDFISIDNELEDLADDFKDFTACLEETRDLINSVPIAYGIDPLDKGVRGMGRRKDVTFIGGYSSVGKTMFVIQTAVHMVVALKMNVIFFSMEMSAGALYERILAMILKVDEETIGAMLKRGDPRVYAIKNLISKRLLVIDKNNMTIEKMDKYIKYANARIFDKPTDCIIVDYLQYMAGSSDFKILSETARGFKPLAKENNIQVIVLSQLNRGIVPWDAPTMQSLKGSGDIEATGDVILLMYKPSMNPELAPEEKKEIKNDIHIIVGKSRYGRKLDEVVLRFDEKEHRLKVLYEYL